MVPTGRDFVGYRLLAMTFAVNFRYRTLAWFRHTSRPRMDAGLLLSGRCRSRNSSGLYPSQRLLTERSASGTVVSSGGRSMKGRRGAVWRESRALTVD